ncbi:MAG: zinc-dependent metalloprotease [Bacteroidia bacterium]
MFKSNWFILIVFIFSSTINVNAQCLLNFTKEQENWLKNFQQQMYANPNSIDLGKNQMLYVPVTFHLVGTSKGLGYFSLQNVLTSLCEVNQRFAPVGMYFYLAETIKYVNDDELYAGKADAIWVKSYDLKNPLTVNVFYHGQNTEGWCGVYFGGVDVVFVLHRCQLPGGTTLTHELGHFFSLPHTFRGWEGGMVPGNIEKLDGTNCTTAGDGFCDTKADYVATRWNCPYSMALTDPNGQIFKPDSSLYMNYANDNCHSRFSNQQIAAMRANLNSRSIASTIPPDNPAITLSPPELVSPLNNDSLINPIGVTLKWRKVSGAYAYHLQVARFGAWDFLNIDQLIVNDTTINIDLFGSWPYAWRVKAISKTNVCGIFSEPNFFTTDENITSINKINQLTDTYLVFPNPAKENQVIKFLCEQKVKIIIYDLQGKIIENISVKPNSNNELIINNSGFYTATFIDENNIILKSIKIIVY